MRKEVVDYIHSKQDLKNFIRVQPAWYRILAKNPHHLDKFEAASINHHEKTVHHQVQKFSNGVNMASMMMQMFQAMNESQ
ncbi:YlbE-like family protein [Bacillus sp. AK031]